MPTIRLVPSTIYNAAGTSYLSVTNADNAYTNTDSNTYATIQNLTASTSSRYIYLRGFNFDDIPSAAVVSSWTIKLKASESGISTSTSYKPYCANGTSTINGTCDVITTTASVHTFSGFTNNWNDIVSMGDNFGIRINCRRASKNTVGYMYIYGAEIEVDYTIPVSATITSTLTGNGTIDPSGAYSTYENTEYTLTITPTNKSDTITVTKNGVDITSQLIAHGNETSANAVLGTYSLVSGSFNGSGASYFQGIVGNGYDTSETTTSNYYSGGSSTIAVFTYDVGITIPSNANVTRLYAMVNGHAESTSNSSEYMCAQLVSGSTELSEELNFKDVGTSNSTQTIEATTLPTVSQLADLKLQCRLGYYGGALNGATVFVEYDVLGGSGVDHYTYTYTVDGNATIAVVISSAAETNKMYFKVNGAWVEVSKVYKKVNGSWVEQSDLTQVFDSNMNYINSN